MSYYKRHPGSYTWFAVTIFLLLVTLILLAGVAQADETGVSYTNAASIIRVSISSTGEQANDDSNFALLSADGRYVGFSSHSTNLAPGSTFGMLQAYVYDAQTQITERVSVSSFGLTANQNVNVEDISADGRFVVFISTASNLVVGDTNSVNDVFVHDRQTKTTTRVSLSPTGEQGLNNSGQGSISADGRFVTFVTNGFTQPPVPNVYVRDREDNVTTLISVAIDGKADTRGSNAPQISDNGRFVVFGSSANNMVISDTNNVNDVFVYDRQAGTTSRVSVSSTGEQANKASSLPKISADGRYVLFTSDATNLVDGDTNNKSDLFLHDRQTGTTSRVSVSSTGEQGNSESGSISDLSSDGLFVTFGSSSSNLVAGDTNGYTDVFLHNIQTGQTTAVHLLSKVDGISPASYFPKVSNGGRFVAFESTGASIVSGDTNGKTDIFLYDREGGLVSGYTISGKVSQPDGTLLEGVKVSINGTEYTTDALGRYTASGLVAGTYQVTATSATAIVTPTVQTVTIPPSNTEVNFSQVCVSPHTGLNVCDLELGDILFYSHNETENVIKAKTLVGTYWFHAALYAGGDLIVHANGVQASPDDDVIEASIYTTRFWVGFPGDPLDWAVLRPKASAAQKQGAIEYAISKAIDPAITYVRSSNLAFLDRGTDNEFACSELVWKAYQVNGYVMEVEASLWRWLYPQYDLLVTPDDLYFSPYFGKSDIVQQKQDNTTTEALKKVLFYLLSPADLLLTDGQGRRVGRNPTTGEEFAEMSNAWHFNEEGKPEVIVMQAREGDTWTLQTTGTGEGNYTVQVVTYGETSVITQTATLTTTVGKVDTFSVTLEAGNTGNEPIKLAHESTTLPTDKKYIYLPLIKR